MMFNSLPQFYNSREWKELRNRIISDRTDKNDGILYCEFSRKPLIKAYDIVAHHKIPLTMANVNDYSISLNPENIMIVSQDAHNQIHSRFGYVTERKVYYIYGAPCSGKTTFVNSVKGNSDIVIDMDNIWQCITGGERYNKPAALKTNAFGIRDCLTDMVRTRAGKWERAYIIEGGAAKGERERKIEMLGAEPILIESTKEECIKHLMDDKNRTQQQKKEWLGYIEQWFSDYTE